MVKEVGVLGTVVVEVVVHMSYWEVVVLSVMGDHRDGSGSRGTRRLVKNHGGSSCTHVVVDLDGTNVLKGSRGTWGLRTTGLGSCDGSGTRSSWEVVILANLSDTRRR